LKLIVIRLLFFFYLTSTYLGATHIHNDALESHGDCKVCIVVKNLNSGDTPSFQAYTLSCDNCYALIAFKLEVIQQNIFKGFNANAPPYIFS